jgi:hypothetical protein
MKPVVMKAVKIQRVLKPFRPTVFTKEGIEAEFEKWVSQIFEGELA